ncbi:S-methyl-5-thioribose kinase [uncultured Mitsuokella sp.]|uniref:S-methyl-5-thioribose kinase n=1 Tax=uncultured Mitsuokella sp. TaxID=453120 RepID=UPI0025D3A173|nr:S-methyl-5-thioribose kinase [uncultured Mitsuokella sp.]
MSDYSKYFLMKAEDVPDYVRTKLPDFFAKDAKLTSAEIGDGNLNYVFRVCDEVSGKTIIVKQAGVELRISKDMHLSTDRGRIEAKILSIQEKFAPGLVPHVYLYDGTMCAITMEDMVGHTMMRTGLLQHTIYPRFAEDISTFMARSLLLSTDVVMDHKEKKELVKSFINPDLCDLTEHLVYTEPYNDDAHRNHVFAPNADFVKKEIYDDEALHLEAAKLKFQFMNDAQSLIHGDLHTGSIFINQQHMYVFDPEFAFYGPMGYDVGNVLANMFFAWCNGDATIADAAARQKFCGWVLQTIADIVDKFSAKFRKIYEENVHDAMAKTPGFLDYYLGTVLVDTAGVTGIELIRRTVGIANVKDITSIADTEKRTRAERIIITLAKHCIMHRAEMKSGKDYLKAIKAAVAKFPQQGALKQKAS